MLSSRSLLVICFTYLSIQCFAESNVTADNLSSLKPPHYRRRQDLTRRTQVSGDPECSWEQRWALTLAMEELIRWAGAASRTVRWRPDDRDLNIARATTFQNSFGINILNRDSEFVGWRFVGLLLEISPTSGFASFRDEQGIDEQGRIKLRCGTNRFPGCGQDGVSVIFPTLNQIVLVSFLFKYASYFVGV